MAKLQYHRQGQIEPGDLVAGRKEGHRLGQFKLSIQKHH